MEVEISNFQERTIPKSCPAEMRAKIEVARTQRGVPAPEPDVEGWDLLKKFASEQEA
jgi:hypothetical protein